MFSPMGSIGRYMFRASLGAFLITLVSLTVVIWFTQAMRDFDLITSQRQTLLVFVGITTGDVTFKHPIFHKPEGTLLCSRNALPADFTRIIQLIETGKIDTTPWITHRTDLAGLAGQFDSYLKPETGVVKAVVEIA